MGVQRGTVTFKCLVHSVRNTTKRPQSGIKSVTLNAESMHAETGLLESVSIVVSCIQIMFTAWRPRSVDIYTLPQSVIKKNSTCYICNFYFRAGFKPTDSLGGETTSKLFNTGWTKGLHRSSSRENIYSLFHKIRNNHGQKQHWQLINGFFVLEGYQRLGRQTAWIISNEKGQRFLLFELKS